MMKRRTLLGSTGISVSAMSGCLNSISGSEPSISIGSVWLANNHSEEHEFQIQLEDEGATVHNSTHILTGDARDEGDTNDSAVSIDCTWDNESGSYTLRARVNEDEWGEFTLPAEADDDTECMLVDVWYAWRDVEEFTLITTSGCGGVSDIEDSCSWAES